MSQQQDQICKSHNDPDGSSTHWTTPDLIEKHWKHGRYLRRDTRLGDCVYMKAKGWFLIHRVKCARWLRPMMTCACVSGCLCVGNDTLVYFNFSLREATVGAVTFVSSGSPLCSQIFTVMCFLFFLCRAHWDTWDTSGRDDGFMHRSTRVDPGREEPELRPSINLFVFCFFFLFTKSANGSQPPGDKVIQTSSYFRFWALNNLQAQLCHAMLQWNWGKRKGSHCIYMQTVVEMVFLLHRETVELKLRMLLKPYHQN